MKIIVCTTFRDFKGTDNDKIQYMFLDNIKNQSYQDFLLVTTTFGEKKVKEVVDGYFGEKSIVRDVTLPSEYRFSLTEVVLSGIHVVKGLNEKCIVIWCTCDIMFEKNFFQTLIDYYSPGISGIVHPNIIYTTLDNMYKNKGGSMQIHKGIDLLFYDGDVLLKGEDDIRKYKFYDWGVFEYFMVGISMVHAKKSINLYCKTKLQKVINDRKLTNESKEYFSRCLALNKPIFKQYCIDKNLPPELWQKSGLYNCHCQYDMLDPTPSYYMMRYSYAIHRFCDIKKKEIKNFLKNVLSFPNKKG